jgi:RimJ/RimL family protein N-acetyltransferase
VGLLRAVDDDDLDVLFEHWTDAESNRLAAFTVADPHDRRAFDERWARLRSDPSVRARTIAVGGAVAGSISSWSNDGVREVTYWLGREHWGKGIATRALAEFLAEVETERPVQAAAAFDNVGSQRVLEKCGFALSGAGRAFANGRGVEVDEVLFRLDA